MGSNKPHKQAAKQRPTKIRYNWKDELCSRTMWCSVINLTVLNCKVSHNKSSSASFFNHCQSDLSDSPGAGLSCLTLL